MKSDPSGKNATFLSGHSVFLIVLYYSWGIISHELWFHNGKRGFLFSGKKEETVKIFLHVKEVGQIWMFGFLWQWNSLWLRAKIKTLNQNLQIRKLWGAKFSLQLNGSYFSVMQFSGEICWSILVAQIMGGIFNFEGERVLEKVESSRQIRRVRLKKSKCHSGPFGSS